MIIVVIPCGEKKRQVASIAEQLYIGSYFRANLGYAQSIAGPNDRYILSAKHGLIPATTTLDPYNLRLGMAGAVEKDHVSGQIDELGIRDRTAVVLGGIDYRKLVAGEFTRVVFVVDVMRKEGRVIGLGSQIQWLRQNVGRRVW